MTTTDERARGIEATSQSFAHYDQVDKRQDYRLAEAERGGERFDDEFRLAVCDARDRDSDAFAGQLGDALRDIGFAVLVNTGVDPALYLAAEAMVVEMFERTALSDKQRFRAARHGAVNQGYFPIKETSDIHPDLVEGWVFARRAFDPARVDEFWPSQSARDVFARVCRAHEPLVLPIARAIMRYLDQDPAVLDARLTEPSYAMRLNYYPPIGDADDASGAGRLLGHEDTDLFTLLPAPTVEGLQALRRRDFHWVRLSAPPGSIVLNVGDYLQRITNDVLPSTTHRVAKPRDRALRGRPRATFPMNVYLREDDVLEVLPGLGAPRYEPIEALAFHTRTTAKYYGDDYAVK